jgi:D-3-phosphoglycerate dehydrogenase
MAGHFKGDNEGRRRLLDAGFEVNDAPHSHQLTEDALVALLRDSHAVVAGVEPYTDAVLRSVPELRTIARWGVGVDNIDIDAATRLGVVVTNTPGLLVDAVADLAFALLLATARRLVEADAAVRTANWRGIRGRLVWGKTLGIVGVGEIGTAVARRARGFDMTVLGYDPMPREDARRLGVAYVRLNELLRQADFVSLHAPATETTRGLIAENELALMKPTAILINTARGSLVDQKALYEALRDGRIAGAGLDVFDREPPDPNDPLLSLPNCIFSPHSGSNEWETVERINRQVAENILAAFGDEVPTFCVNPQAWSHRRL